MRDKESKSGVWSYGDSPRETLIFQAICGCRPIASVGRLQSRSDLLCNV